MRAISVLFVTTPTGPDDRLRRLTLPSRRRSKSNLKLVIDTPQPITGPSPVERTQPDQSDHHKDRNDQDAERTLDATLAFRHPAHATIPIATPPFVQHDAHRIARMTCVACGVKTASASLDSELELSTTSALGSVGIRSCSAIANKAFSSEKSKKR